MLKCESVSKKIGEFQLKEINFELPKGYVLGVIGRNGTGKTTLLRCLTGIYRLAGKGVTGASGDVHLDGISINAEEKAFKKQYVFVSHDLPYRSTYRVKELGEMLGCYYDGFTMKRYLENLKRFELPEKKLLEQLSTGQKIRVQLAFALSVDVKLYIFDEPTANLDVEFRDEFYKIVRELMETGEKSVIYASHLVEELEEMADYVLWLQEKDEATTGHYFGTMDELKERYRMLEGAEEVLTGIEPTQVVGGRNRESHGEWLVRTEGLSEGQKAHARYADLKEIFYYEEKGEVQ